jgi:hypothetical protein
LLPISQTFLSDAEKQTLMEEMSADAKAVLLEEGLLWESVIGR